MNTPFMIQPFYFQAEKDRLEGFMEGVTFADYVAKMRNNGTYVDHIFIQEFYNSQRCSVSIIHGANTADINVIPSGSSDKNITVGYITHIKHYVSLVSK